MNEQNLGKITARRIRQARESAGLTQAELGDYLGLSGDAVSKWENGRAVIQLHVLEQLPAVLKRSVTWFLGLDGELTEDEAKLVELFRQLPAGPFRGQALRFLATWLEESLEWDKSDRDS